MATRAQRWRGPRRPDVNELRGSLTARATQQQQQAPDAAQTQRAMDDSTLVSLGASGTVSVSASVSPSSLSSSHVTLAPGVPHHKYNFLSAGHSILSNSSDGLRVNRRPGIMDATRSFEKEKEGQPEPQTIKMARAYEQAQRDRAAAGLGYGTSHANHFTYLSKSLPPREADPLFGDRPCLFPTIDLPPLNLRRATPFELDSLPFEEQEEYQRMYKTNIASGLGYGTKRNTHFAYLANTYWRKP